MRPISTAAIAMAALLLSTPASLAWSSFGQAEPDNALDTTDFMFMENGPASADHVYFNAWTSTQTTVSPNVGALGTSNEALEMERPYAIFGVWVDCNDDGYVGHAESALYEYSATLLVNDEICPPVTSEDTGNWTPGAHNFNGWVSELVPIGRAPEDLENRTDARVYYDNGAFVWADFGLPDDLLAEGEGGSCPVNPFPRGTMQSTGGLLNYLDCGNDLMETWNEQMEAAGNPLGLMFEDDDDARGSFADVPTFGSDHSNEAAVSVFDCREEQPFFDSAAAVNESGLGVEEQFDAIEAASGEEIGDGYEYYGLKVWPVNPRVVDSSSPTAPGQVNQSLEEGPSFEAIGGGDCNFQNDGGNDFYGTLNEGEPVGDADAKGKSVVEWPFLWSEGYRGDVEDFCCFGLEQVAVPGDGTAGTSATFGVGLAQPLFGTGWFGSGNLLKAPPQTLAFRANVAEQRVQPPAPWIVTYYAYTSLIGASFGEVTLVGPGGSGIYGTAQCGEFTDGIHGGWECDPAKWNKNANGSPLDDSPFMATVGQAYNFRDIDCYDGRTNAGVPLSAQALADDRCTPYPAAEE